MNEPALIPAGSLVDDAILAYRQASVSPNTRRAVAKVWRQFEQWCWTRQVQAFPCAPDTLEAYLIHLANSGRKAATIEQVRYGINTRHKLAGLTAPGDSHIVKSANTGIRRTIGTRQKQAAAFTIEDVRKVQFPDSLMGLRDRALLMAGACGGFRRSELVGLLVEDVEYTADGLRLLLRHSKGDQEAKGAWVDIPLATDPSGCPVAALTAWITRLRAYRQTGPLFPAISTSKGPHNRPLTAQVVGHIVKWAAEQIGLNPDLYSGHSLRAGCATYLLAKGIALHVVADHLRHQSVDVTRRHDRNSTARALKGAY